MSAIDIEIEPVSVGPSASESEDKICRRRLAFTFQAANPVRLHGMPKSGPQDEARMFAFHDADWQEKLSIVQEFDDERLRLFGLRLLYLEARSILPEALRAELERALSQRLVGDETGSSTVVQALSEIDRMLIEGTMDDGTMLTDYRTYLVGRLARITNSRTKQFPT